MASRDESDEKFDWSRTWVAEMFMSSEDAVKRKAEIDRLQGITPESKRLTEIKAGVILTSVGIGLMIFLFVFMGGLIASGRVSEAAAEILSRLWIAGVLPLLIGGGLIFNGMVVSKRGTPKSLHDTAPPNPPTELKTPATPEFLSPAETTDLASGTPFSVTDETTKHLKVRR